MKKRRRHLTVICVIILIVAGVTFLLDRHMRPLVREYAVNRARIVSGNAMAKAVEAVLNGSECSYDSLTVVERDANGAVLSVETESTAVNRLCNAITTSLNQMLEQEEYSCLKIPLSNATGSMFAMGRGIRVTLRIMQSSSAVAAVHSVFTDAGINQTLHRLELNVSFRSNVLVYGMTEPIETSGSFLIAETVIVGGVPNTYADIGRVTK